MKDLLPFLVVGLSTGSIYGLAGVGLVLTYRTAGVFNFAHGAVAALGAYMFYDLRITHGWPWPVALVVSVLAVGVLGGMAVAWLTRYLAGARIEMQLVATVGLLLLVQGFLVWKFGGTTQIYPAFLPTKTVSMAGVSIQYGQIIVFVLAGALAAGLYLFLRGTTIGAVMRGVVDDRSLVSLAGFGPDAVQRLSWMLGCGLAALSGILIAPSLGLDSSLLTLLVVQAFGACAIGLFSSLPLTYAGGLVVGVAASLTTKFGTTRVLQGLGPSVPFLILFVALLVVPARKLASQPRTFRFKAQVALPKPAIRALAGAGVVLLALVPWFADVRLTSYTAALAMVPAFLSLALLVYVSGSISLCQAAFAALGATTFAHLTHAGVPWLLALVLAGLAVVPLGAVVAIPAIRLQGIYLALATFGFGILLEKVAYPAAVMFGTIGARRAPRPHFWGINGADERGFYFVVLMVALTTTLLVVALIRNRIGRLLLAMGDSPTALSTHGLSVNVTRVLVFCVSAALAGISGALIASQSGRVGATGFTSFQSLMWLAVLVVCGRRPVLSAYLAGAMLLIVPAYAPDGFVNYQTMLFGAAALMATLLPELKVGRRLATAEDRRHRSPVRARMATSRSVTTGAPVLAAVGAGEAR